VDSSGEDNNAFPAKANRTRVPFKDCRLRPVSRAFVSAHRAQERPCRANREQVCRVNPALEIEEPTLPDKAASVSRAPASPLSANPAPNNSDRLSDSNGSGTP
jgi:hypothetical protein